MRIFVIAAMGAAVLAGCAPAQHGHFNDGARFLNSNGDPRGTALVYQDGPVYNSQFAPASIASAPSPAIWPQQTGVAQHAFGAGGFPVTHSQQVTHFSQPVGFSAPAQSFAVPQAPIQRASVAVPTISQPISYTPAVQQTIAPLAQTTLAPIVQHVAPPAPQPVVRPVVQHVLAPQPVQHTVVRPAIRQALAPQPVRQPVVLRRAVVQAPAPQPVRQLLTRASFVEPTRPNPTVVATSFGGHQIDADGYAICNVQLPNHAALQKPKFKKAFQPASLVKKSQPKPQWRF